MLHGRPPLREARAVHAPWASPSAGGARGSCSMGVPLRGRRARFMLHGCPPLREAHAVHAPWVSPSAGGARGSCSMGVPLCGRRTRFMLHGCPPLREAHAVHAPWVSPYSGRDRREDSLSSLSETRATGTPKTPKTPGGWGSPPVRWTRWRRRSPKITERDSRSRQGRPRGEPPSRQAAKEAGIWGPLDSLGAFAAWRLSLWRSRIVTADFSRSTRARSRRRGPRWQGWSGGFRWRRNPGRAGSGGGACRRSSCRRRPGPSP